VALLGQSPHARTYLAEGPTGLPVVVKELSFATVPSTTALDAFEREGRLLQRLAHPAIPRYLDSFQEGTGIQTRLYLVEEFIEGVSLEARLKAGPITEAEAERWSREVLGILGYLHGLSPQVIHRDIKPSNLLLRPDGSVVLIDFGAARDLVKGATFNATLVGTFGYMPLEQLGGTVDPSCDLYALGATLLHLLTGRPPWEAMNGGTSIDVEDQLEVSPRMKRLLRGLLAPRGRRYSTVDEALAELRGSTPLAMTRFARHLTAPRSVGFARFIGVGIAVLALGLGVLAGVH
jgi:serine/threonine-protein kinase